MNAPSRHTELHALLDANHEFSLMHSDTTNHCPMALTALAEMGAEPHQLRAFFDFWESERAEPAEATRYDIGWGRWDTAVGRLDAFFGAAPGDGGESGGARAWKKPCARCWAACRFRPAAALSTP
ncbi:hypothetical protein JOS77_09400 [Chromobacterium haemolyticum]|nr:hypothetical protein JOS77_09400 [Chromobacterium haemolyticum]